MPLNSTLWAKRGITLHNQGHYEEAVSDFTEALRRDPQYVEAQRLRAEAHLARGAYDEAEADFRGILTTYPDPMQIRLMLSQLYAVQNRHREAIEQLTQVLREEPHNAYWWEMRGVQRYCATEYKAAVADFEEAVTCYSRALEAENEMDQERRATLLNSRAWSRVRAGRELTEAIADASRSLDLSPAEARASRHHTRAVARLLKGEYAAALRDIDQALEAERDALGLLTRSVILRGGGDPSGADVARAAALELDPAIEAHYNVRFMLDACESKE
jgi:tetratricopeptide (TPR) repeat protein